MRLIDADALKEWAEEYHASNWGIPQDELIYAIGSAPTIEPKNVVEDYCRPRNLMVVAAEDFHRLVEQMLQTIDVPDRKFGEWKPAIVAKNIDALECSECGAKYPNLLWMPGYSYCPNCGARMERIEE